ncbi:MAG: RidA family protein [Pseudomonadota bacterium]
MTDRTNIFSASPFEEEIGFSRAVRVGDHVFIAGCGPIGGDGKTVPGTVADQARRCFEIIAETMAKAGGSLADVVRTRMFVKNPDDWQAIGAVHQQFFGDIRPAATLVACAGYADDAWLIEVEADAVMSAR